MRYFFLFLVIVMSTTQVSAGIVETAGDIVEVVNETVEITKFIYDLLGQKVWDRDWKISKKEGTPVKNWKHSTHISAWIDVIGFRNESRINGTRYVNGSAKDFAIIKRFSKYHMSSGERKVSFESTCSVSDSFVLNGTNTTTATQISTLIYEIKVRTLLGYKWVRQPPEKLTVSCTVDSPENFTTRIPNINTTITAFNRSFEPVTYVSVPNENHSSMKDVMVVVFDYNGSKITRYDQIGFVCENDRGCEYVEFVDNGLPEWVKDENQSVIDHRGHFVTIFDNPFNESKLNISVHTPYETKYVSNFEVIEADGRVKLSVPLLKTFIMMIFMIFGIILIGKVVSSVL